MSNRVYSTLARIGPQLLIRGIVLIGLLAGAGYLIRQYEFGQLVEQLRLTEGPAAWFSGPVLFVVLGAAFTSLGGPRQAVSFFSAYLFGFGEGFGLALGASALGCLAAYAAARLFSDLARRIIRGRMDVAVRIWSQDAFAITLILRLLPVGSNFLANLAAGAASIPPAGFFLGSVTGYVPQTLVFSLMGSGVNIGSGAQVTLSLALFLASTLIGVWVYARYRKRLNRTGPADPRSVL